MDVGQSPLGDDGFGDEVFRLPHGQGEVPGVPVHEHRPAVGAAQQAVAFQRLQIPPDGRPAGIQPGAQLVHRHRLFLG